MFFCPFSIAITSLREETANLSAFRTFVRFALVWFCLFPLPLGVWEGLRFVIVALPGLFSYLFSCFLCLFSDELGLPARNEQLYNFLQKYSQWTDIYERNKLLKIPSKKKLTLNDIIQNKSLCKLAFAPPIFYFLEHHIIILLECCECWALVKPSLNPNSFTVDRSLFRWQILFVFILFSS